MLNCRGSSWHLPTDGSAPPGGLAVVCPSGSPLFGAKELVPELPRGAGLTQAQVVQDNEEGPDLWQNVAIFHYNYPPSNQWKLTGS